MTITELIDKFKTLPKDIYVVLENNKGELLPGTVKMTHRRIRNSNLHKLWQLIEPSDRRIVRDAILLDLNYKINHSSLDNNLEILNIRDRLGIDKKLINSFLFEPEGRNIEHVSIKRAKQLHTLKEVSSRAAELERRVIRLNLPNNLKFYYTLDGLNLVKNIYSTMFYGIGLNKNTICVDNKQLMPGNSIIISTLPDRNNSYCDFSISRGNQEKPVMKYTKLLYDLKNDDL